MGNDMVMVSHQENHKTTKSKECIWHNKFIGVVASKKRDITGNLTEQYLSIGGINVTNLVSNTVSDCHVAIIEAASALCQKIEDCATNGADKTAENDGN
eukprot:3525461-Ditylum_brightwellii.AAC.1